LIGIEVLLNNDLKVEPDLNVFFFSFLSFGDCFEFVVGLELDAF